MSLLSPPLTIAGRILPAEECSTDLDWINNYYWIDSKGPLVVISQQNKLIEYKQQVEPVASQVPEPSYALVIFILATVLFAWLGNKKLQ